jgi:hypothetical protein
MKPGPNLDGVIHDRLDRNIEYGTIESSNDQPAAECSSKFLKDRKKVQKAMRDMVHGLVRGANFDRGVVDDLCVIGFATSGLIFQVVQMTQPKGHIFLLKAEKPMAVPQSVRQFSEFLMVMIHILQATVAAFSCATQ